MDWFSTASPAYLMKQGRRDELKDSVPALEGKEGKDVPSIVNVVSFINVNGI